MNQNAKLILTIYFINLIRDEIPTRQRLEAPANKIANYNCLYAKADDGKFASPCTTGRKTRKSLVKQILERNH